MTDDLYRNAKLPWLDPKGAESDVVLASRIRLARNFQRMPFPNQADASQLAAVKNTVTALMPAVEKALGQIFDRIDMEETGVMERELLCVKHIVNRNFLKQPENRAVFISDDRRMSISVNDEDHLRISCIVAGMNPELALQMAFQADDILESRIDMAFDEKLGYLTSWPTNLGTGLRVSALLHLPGLVFTDNINDIVNIAPQLGLNMNGLFTDGKQVLGNLFRISNQLTLGFSENEILTNIKAAVQEIVSHERRARKALELHDSNRLEDRVWRAYGEMRYARRMHSGDALALMSKLRLGIDLKIIEGISAECFSELFTVNREGYLKCFAGNEKLTKEELYRMRAELIRDILQRYTIVQR